MTTQILRGLLAALCVAMVGGCARDYVMPPAKVRLLGYQIESKYSQGLAIIKRSDDLRQGYMDREGRIVIAPRFFDAGLFAEGLAPVSEDYTHGYGYIDLQGRMAIKPRFDAALPFSGSLAPVRVGGKWGFIDHDGAFRIPPTFDDAFAFSEGRARVVVDGFAGFIDEQGAWVAPPVYFRAGDFRDGLAFVCGSNRCGFIGRDGRVAIPLRYDDAGSFSEGRAPVRESNAWGYIDQSGTVVIPLQFDQAADFSDGVARVAKIKNASFDRKFGGYSGRAPFFGFIDRTGTMVIATVLLGVEPFSGGSTAVRVPARGFSSDSYDVRLINRAGTFLPGRFDIASGFAEGRAVVKMGNRSYVINSNGHPVVELDTSYPGDPSYSARNVSAVRYGYSDPSGTQVIAHTFLAAQPFSEGLAFVEGPWSRRSRLRGYVNTRGQMELALPESIAQAFPFSNGRSLVSLQGPSLRYGYINRSGAMCISAQYANAGPFTEGCAAVKVSRSLGANDWGYIDTNGTMVIPPRFKDAGPFAHGLAYAEWVTPNHILSGAIITTNGTVVVDKPFLMEWSHALFGVPSVEQHRIRRGMVISDGLIPRLEGGVRTYVNVSNSVIIKANQFISMGLFAEGRAPVLIQDSPLSYQGTWGYIDTKGRIVGTLRFFFAGPFSEGMAAVRDQAGRTGYVKRDGTWAIEPMWLEEAHPFKAGRALVKLNNRWGYLDSSGRFAIPPQYLRADSFSEGLALTAIAAPSKIDAEK